MKLTGYAQAFTHALYNIAAYPQYVQPLREEIEGIVAQDGWSKASLGKMRKLDSFFKETMRLADGSLRVSLRLSIPSFLQLTSRPQWVSFARR